ncbi:hemerythrin domain-containing protein [Phycicoccus sp. DTK01]|uniref:hemerythrin domain-containing protein n=1 Tax=Phycicoccus sp. DTK01 TaxID=2785745 RepID=UPI001A8C1DD4|nr:hemerythrin domain-containing protein [Phycicoccus sp. DTK01]GIL36843.1 hypothetical protein PDTK01_29180 [Phycicoccus sp. DTK01]
MDTTSRQTLGLIDLTPAHAHAHDSDCWWDHRAARWACALPSSASDAGDEPTPPVATTRDAAPAPGVDVRDMLVVHTALLRELRLAAPAVERVAHGDRRQARRVEQHLALLADVLHHHHSGEDELLWPVLRPRLAPPHAALLDVAESQHEGIDHALERVAAARRDWSPEAAKGSGAVLAAALRELHLLLAEHLEFEERHLLPLAAVHLTEAEWHAVGAAGAAGVPRSALPLVVGMFAYEGDPEVLATMLRSAPLVPRVLVPRIAPRVYARRALAVHGTTRP